MENPASWGPVEQTVHREYQQWLSDRDAGMVGASLAMRVANALRSAGLIVGEFTIDYRAKGGQLTESGLDGSGRTWKEPSHGG
jgi:hypothetical protein